MFNKFGCQRKNVELWKSVLLVKNTELRHGAKLGIGILTGGKLCSRNHGVRWPRESGIDEFWIWTMDS